MKLSLKQIALKERRKLLNLHLNLPKSSLHLSFLQIHLNRFNLNSLDENGQTLLHKAVNYNNLPLVRYLLDKGACINTIDVNGNTPLLSAIQATNHPMVCLLVQNGSSVNKKQQQQTSEPRSLGQVADYLFHYLNKVCPSSTGSKLNPPQCQPPLHEAINRNNYQVARLLLNRGADPNELDDKYGLSSIHLACCKTRNTSLVKLLLKYNADVNVLSKNNYLPLHFCLMWTNHPSTIRLVFECTLPERLNVPDGNAHTAMDRLWMCMNSFVSGNKQKRQRTMTEYRNLLRLFILKGGRLNYYSIKPHMINPNRSFASNYLVRNVLFLLKSIVINRKVHEFFENEVNYQKCLITVLKYVLDRLLDKCELAVRYLSTCAGVNESDEDFKQELNEFRSFTYVLLTNEHRSINRAILEFILNSLICSNRRWPCFTGSELSTHQERVVFYSNRTKVTSYLRLVIGDVYAARPLQLKELSRALVRGNLIRLDRNEVIAELKLPTQLSYYLFYE